MTNSVVEISSQKHLEDVIEMAKAFHTEIGSAIPLEPEQIGKYYEMLRYDLDRDSFNCFIAYKGDEAVGFLVCKLSPYFFSSMVAAYQELWYVRPAFRSTRIAFDLIRAFEDWARLRGAAEIYTGQVTNDPVKGKKVSKVLTKLGYPRVGSYHRMVTISQEG
jgi:GNAT superfamily N-acetyltransferase